ncbi:MAG: UDP-N-acetylmuramoyl-L-alanyl-D-glutamate--2,6-diaminopimelate ligase [Nitrospirae bacterium]|nr:UDP-N-acetylmuramoyl-L-alanyl-D-glutamate--2,6-diaminopimelate ligase [Nitrospirota bacterium]
MRLDGILKEVGAKNVSGDTDREITSVTCDSRTVTAGSLFVAISGEVTDGHMFIADALRSGAAAVIYERSEAVVLNSDAAFIQVQDGRAALAVAANIFYGRPSHSMHVIGVTGTNGKTTTAYIIKSILEGWGKKVGLIGTIEYIVAGKVSRASHTTPEAPEFQRLLGEMLKAGCTHVVTEVSSHALSQRRVDGTLFRTVVFTNLTRDHLDFHTTMEEYYLAKERLFRGPLCGDGHAVINADDEYGGRLRRECANALTYGLETASDIAAADIENTSSGLRFVMAIKGEKHRVVSSLMGLQNVYNILAATGACLSAGAPVDTIIDGIKDARAIRGRFERVEAGQQFLAIIDFAHTEDALERLIKTARGLGSGKIITVFGCGGNRDRGKRPAMGAVAAKLSDFVVITSDNPRNEDPDDIIREIVAGVVSNNYLVEPDRKEAIKKAALMADRGDILLLAGKGHEEYQEIRGGRLKFSDREVLEDTIRRFITGK